VSTFWDQHIYYNRKCVHTITWWVHSIQGTRDMIQLNTVTRTHHWHNT